MKKIIPILIIAAIMLLAIPMSVIADGEGYTNVLELDNKDSSTWQRIPDEIEGTLYYNAIDTNFNFQLVADGIADDSYSLIYYADYSGDRFGQWGGDNPGKVIGTYQVTGNHLDITNSVDIGHNLPVLPDANVSEHDYCETDSYSHCHGAKIWLIPTSALTDGELPVTAWPPNNNWLFETDLINYTCTTNDNQIVSLVTEIPEDLICVSVNPNSIDFGSIYRGQCKELRSIVTITNCGNVPITVTAVTSGSLYGDGNLDISTGSGWVELDQWSYPLDSGQSKELHLKLCIPASFPTGTAQGSLGFLAEAQ